MYKLGFEQHSGRVISLGRFMLALLFLIAIWLDASQPAVAETETYGLLLGYVIFALALIVATWNNWWLEARLAGPAHLFDIGMFTILVFATEGYTSPFFLFFVFLLLSAAIRWSWRETGLTAAAVVILYFAAGLLVATSPDFELQRFIIRSGHLFILSALLIWFGINQGTAGSLVRRRPFATPPPSQSPREAAVRAATDIVGASQGVLLWRDADSGKPAALRIRGGEREVESSVPPRILAKPERGPLLYDVELDKAVSRDPARQILFGPASKWMDIGAARRLGLSTGLAVPIRGEEGELFLQGIRSLSVDHIDFGTHLSSDIADLMRRHALFRAMEESGEARARLALARDLHDSVVQFLAGATFRIEAMMRQAKSGSPVDPELQELKRLMLQEQDDLRSFIGALRSGREVEFSQVASELQSLAEKLGRQWNISCTFWADVEQRTIPMRLHLDALQLVREAVANAVRHGSASAVRIYLVAEDNIVRLELQDDGIGFPAAMTLASNESDDLQPRSLRERVHEAGGELMLATLEHGTSVTITLPIRGRQ